MTTREFIAQALNGTTKRDIVSSVLRHGDTVYSYGSHYPLARVIRGKVFVNSAGYSNTTSKHICWAREAASDLGLEAISVPLTSGDGLDVQGIIRSATREHKRLKDIMAAKKRKNTMVYDRLAAQANEMIHVLLVLDGLETAEL